MYIYLLFGDYESTERSQYFLFSVARRFFRVRFFVVVGNEVFFFFSNNRLKPPKLYLLPLVVNSRTLYLNHTQKSISLRKTSRARSFLICHFLGWIFYWWKFVGRHLPSSGIVTSLFGEKNKLAVDDDASLRFMLEVVFSVCRTESPFW